MRYLYAKIPVSKAGDIGVAAFRQKTPDGVYVIINESDLQTYGPNADFSSKVEALGGVVLTANEARQALNK